MSDMNPYLAAMYNTNGAAEQMTEDMQKTANMELFCKLAADNGLDLSQLTDEQIAGVYAQVFPEDLAKHAEDEKKEEHEEKESPNKEKKEEHEASESEEDEKKEEEAKKAAAAEYVQEKQAAVEKCAEADWMGRIMAHSFTQEREQIEIAKVASIVEHAQEQGWTEEQLIEAVKEATAREMVGKAVEKLRGAGGAVAEKARAGGKFVAEKAKDTAGSVAHARKQAIEHGERQAGKLKDIKSGVLSNVPDKAKWEARKAVAKGVAAKYAPHAAGVAALGAAEEGARHALKKKEGSAQAFEELAANHAIKVAEAAGYNVEEAAQRVSAVYTLGLSESEKIAHVQDVDTATHVRALEYLEAASYPVNWEEIFGS